MGSRHQRPRGRPCGQEMELPNQRGRRGLLRTQDRPQDQGRHRTHLAVLHRPVRLQPARTLRPRIHHRRQHQGPAHHAPPGHLRIHRTLLRHPRRKLRRRLSPLARPRTAHPAPGHGLGAGLLHGGQEEGGQTGNPRGDRPGERAAGQTDPECGAGARASHRGGRGQGARVAQDRAAEQEAGRSGAARHRGSVGRNREMRRKRRGDGAHGGETAKTGTRRGRKMKSGAILRGMRGLSSKIENFISMFSILYKHYL
mmetsp:Transcript_13372/g.29495  ORF Transcript_13372/g.29495 Transcript_13372/m.29495 type:complete len:255 (+) Transcript_13372:1704-2468(+)